MVINHAGATSQRLGWATPLGLKYIIYLLLILSNGIATGQKNDYIWLAGWNSVLHGPSDTLECNIKLDFNYSPVKINLDSISMNFDFTNVTFSDSSGKLLLYCNGIRVYNAFDQLIENGDSLNTGYLLNVFNPGIQNTGYRTPQGIIALPNVASRNQYYLVYTFGDSLPGSAGQGLYWDKILTTLVDVNANSGMGKVIYKNQPLLIGNLSASRAAVKHGNGRDWWLTVQKRETNCFFTMLLDSNGFQIIDSTCAGPIISTVDGDQSCFSPDGSKFIYMGLYSGLSIFDFDRCTGKLSNLKNLSESVVNDTGSYSWGVAVSPNNRFLYVTNGWQLLQFDLFSDNLKGSMDTIGTYDGYVWQDQSEPSIFHMCQLAPDGKIYISSPGAMNYYHVINAPDEAGIACDFKQHSVYLRTAANSLPNYPNYRLGSLTQAQCDTLASLTDVQRSTKEQQIKVYPNPAIGYAIIDYGFTDWSKGPVSLEICNALGQAIYTKTLPMYSGLQKIDIGAFAGGMYTVYVKRQNAIVATQKLVKNP